MCVCVGQCLEVIRSAVLEERGLHPARRLSVIQRAHKILQTHYKTKASTYGYNMHIAYIQ